jgi:RHS repeat-associated protein
MTTAGSRLNAAYPPTGYVIDGRNRRVGRKAGGVLQVGYLYEDQLRIVAEVNGAGQLVSRYVHGTRANVPELMVKAGATYRLVTDQLGSPRLLVNVTTGAIAQQIDYDEYGIVTKDTNPGFQPFAFAGGLRDPSTGLLRFGARDYDPQVGRWILKDRAGFNSGSPGLYEYVSSDPVNGIDPEGLAQRGKRNIGTGPYTKKSPWKTVMDAAKKAAAEGKPKYAMALKGLAKVIKRAGAMGFIVGELVAPDELNAGEPNPSDFAGEDGSGEDGDPEDPFAPMDPEAPMSPLDPDAPFSPLEPACPVPGSEL